MNYKKKKKEQTIIPKNSGNYIQLQSPRAAQKLHLEQ